MKGLVAVTMLVGCLVTGASRLGAQDCSNLGNWDLRGTYTFWGNGWIDLSRDVDPSLPKGYSPFAFLQGFVFDGKGGGTGWFSSNFGGVQLDAPMRWTYAVHADCSVRGTQSFFLNGAWTPPISVIWVIAYNGNDLELNGFIQGSGPGSQVPHGTARRMSTRY